MQRNKRQWRGVIHARKMTNSQIKVKHVSIAIQIETIKVKFYEEYQRIIPRRVCVQWTVFFEHWALGKLLHISCIYLHLTQAHDSRIVS